MKRIVSLFLVCGVFLGCAAQAAEPASTSSVQAAPWTLSDYDNGEVLVEYTDGSIEVLTFEDEASLASGLEALADDETVVYFQPNFAYRSDAISTNDAQGGQQWALSNDGSFQMQEEKNRYPVYEDPFSTPFAPGRWTMPQDFGRPGGPGGRMRQRSYWTAATPASAVAGVDINVETAWQLYDGGSRDVVIALIDTGVDYSHEDLQDAIWVNEGEIPGNGIDDDGNGYVDDVYGWNFYRNNNRVYTGSEDSHGTHGAGTMLAASGNGVGIAGIVPGGHVKVMVLKALGGSEGEGSTAAIIQAIRYAEANGASICNLSLGSDQDDRALYRAIASSNMLFVAAAGNDGTDTDRVPSYPASYDLDNIISVANLNYDGTLHSSSSYGVKSVDLAAPGSYILSTTPGNGYSYMTGTSMATPMVTAAAAMVYSQYQNISLADVKEILLSAAKPLDSLNGAVATGGMLDLGAAMAYDLNCLSGETWTPLAVGTGSAPEIAVQESIVNGRNYLSVAVSDPDGDLFTLAYATGELTASQFQGGSAGRQFTLDSDGTALFAVNGSGTLTFYACDCAGNETVTVYTVEGNTQDEWGELPSMPDRRWDAPDMRPGGFRPFR